jgi:hypothetical protein
VQGEEGREVDVMAFDAYMRLLREPPVRNALGLRQFEFYIDACELTNTYSKGLNADVTFTLSGTVQPKSACIAHQRDSDYPALIVYSAIYDLRRLPRARADRPTWHRQTACLSNGCRASRSRRLRRSRTAVTAAMGISP